MRVRRLRSLEAGFAGGIYARFDLLCAGWFSEDEICHAEGGIVYVKYLRSRWSFMRELLKKIVVLV